MADVEGAQAKVEEALRAGYEIDEQIAQLREQKRNLGLDEALEELAAAEREARGEQNGETVVEVNTAEETEEVN